ncbi:hypothetical protein DFQ29_006664 [Apophysomyces sp. BC1021]|nr:hypothetical protein DFQ29_006664 [Apophysomyces sp. BC1021]
MGQGSGVYVDLAPARGRGLRSCAKAEGRGQFSEEGGGQAMVFVRGWGLACSHPAVGCVFAVMVVVVVVVVCVVVVVVLVILWRCQGETVAAQAVHGTHGDGGSINYPTLGCRGQTVGIGREGDEGTDPEKLDHGRAGRAQQGRVVGLVVVAGLQERLAHLAWDVDLLNGVGKNKALEDILELGLQALERDPLLRLQHVLSAHRQVEHHPGCRRRRRHCLSRRGRHRQWAKVVADRLSVILHRHIKRQILHTIGLFKVSHKVP